MHRTPRNVIPSGVNRTTHLPFTANDRARLDHARHAMRQLHFRTFDLLEFKNKNKSLSGVRNKKKSCHDNLKIENFAKFQQVA